MGALSATRPPAVLKIPVLRWSLYEISCVRRARPVGGQICWRLVEQRERIVIQEEVVLMPGTNSCTPGSDPS